MQLKQNIWKQVGSTIVGQKKQRKISWDLTVHSAKPTYCVILYNHIRIEIKMSVTFINLHLLIYQKSHNDGSSIIKKGFFLAVRCLFLFSLQQNY